MEASSRFRPSSGAAVAFEGNLQGCAGGVRGRSRGPPGRSGGPVDENKPDRNSQCGAAGVEEVPLRSVLCEQEALDPRSGSAVDLGYGVNPGGLGASPPPPATGNERDVPERTGEGHP